jgi:hypothetical protein
VTRRRVAWLGPVLLVASVTTAEELAAQTSGDRDRVLEAVAVQELKSNPRSTCVVVLPKGWVDHSQDGGMGMPMEALSPWLLKRLRRKRANLQTMDGQCSDPVVWLGPISFDEPDRRATVWVGDAGNTAGRTSYTVRRGFLGRWRAKVNCCLE